MRCWHLIVFLPIFARFAVMCAVNVAPTLCYVYVVIMFLCASIHAQKCCMPRCKGLHSNFILF